MDDVDKNLFYVVPGLLIHVFSLFSSSFVEEEHQLLYHLWTGFSAIQVYNTFVEHNYMTTAKWTVSMILHRFCKDLNYVGNQWSEFYSLGDWFRESQNQMYLSALLIFGKLRVQFSNRYVSFIVFLSYSKLFYEFLKFKTLFIISGLFSIFFACISINRMGNNNKKYDMLSIITFVLYFWNLCCIYVYRVETKEVFTLYGYDML